MRWSRRLFSARSGVSCTCGGDRPSRRWWRTQGSTCCSSCSFSLSGARIELADGRAPPEPAHPLAHERALLVLGHGEPLVDVRANAQILPEDVAQVFFVEPHASE